MYSIANRPAPLVIRAWLWLAAEADDLEEKRRYLARERKRERVMGRSRSHLC